MLALLRDPLTYSSRLPMDMTLYMLLPFITTRRVRNFSDFSSLPDLIGRHSNADQSTPIRIKDKRYYLGYTSIAITPADSSRTIFTRRFSVRRGHLLSNTDIIISDASWVICDDIQIYAITRFNTTAPYRIRQYTPDGVQTHDYYLKLRRTRNTPKDWLKLKGLIGYQDMLVLYYTNTTQTVLDFYQAGAFVKTLTYDIGHCQTLSIANDGSVAIGTDYQIWLVNTDYPQTVTYSDKIASLTFDVTGGLHVRTCVMYHSYTIWS